MSDDDLRQLLHGVRAANLSNAAANRESLRGLVPLDPLLRACGPAVTVRTSPGDWLKPVQAIDRAAAGTVLVIDAGGRPPAVWGELATETCLCRGIAGLVVDGAVRDTADIRRAGFPVWARTYCADAGEPRGEGTIDQPIELCGQRIHPGDWIVADADGVIVLGRQEAIDLARAAREVGANEERLRQQIRAGATLARLVAPAGPAEGDHG